MTRNPDFDAVMIKKTELDALRAEIERLKAARNAALMAKTRLDDFADKANAGQVHYSARELKRKIGAAFADLDAALEHRP